MDHTIHVWDAGEGRTVSRSFKGHTNDVNSVAFSPDGKYIICGSRDTAIRVWDARKCNTVSAHFKAQTIEASDDILAPGFVDNSKLIDDWIHDSDVNSELIVLGSASESERFILA
jgi:WD40 repeat protein